MIVQDLDHCEIADDAEHVSGGGSARIVVKAKASAYGQVTSATTYTQAYALVISYRSGK
jgi:hypothetical protein